MSTVLRIALLGLAALVALWFLIALVLIASPAPVSAPDQPDAVSSERACEPSATTRCFTVRDGAVLHAAWLDAGAASTIIYLHGAFSTGREFDAMAGQLRDALGVNVLSVDQCGHGQSGGRPGDTDYIGQYEDDLADVVTQVRQQNPGVRIILAGHSMGGGVVLRYAARKPLPPLDGYLLLAPHLGATAPTTRSGEPAPTDAAAPPVVALHGRRTIGLIMLNVFGITALNGQDTLYFTAPAELRVRRYTFRAMAGAAPDDYRTALNADGQPLLIVVGGADEAFDAAAYPGVVAGRPNASASVIAGVSHDGILRSSAAVTEIARWFEQHIR